MELELINYENKKIKPSIKICCKKLKPYINKENEHLVYELRELLHQVKNRQLLLKLRYYNLYEQYEVMLSEFKAERNADFKSFSTNAELLTLIQLSINDYDLSNVAALDTEITESELIYTINFEFGFFDSLQKSTLDILEKIYNTSKEIDNYKYINKKLWLEYAQNHIEVFNLSNNVQIRNELKYDYSPSAYSIDNPKYGILYEDTVFNEEQLLYSFLGMLFSCNNINPIIKKCKCCNKFFIAHKTDTENCNRINDGNYTCNKMAINKSKSKYKNNFVHAMEKRIRDLYKSETMITEKEIFEREYPLNRKELSGKEYLYWLAEHYKTEAKKKEWKNKIDEYIKNNDTFEEDFAKYKKLQK